MAVGKLNQISKLRQKRWLRTVFYVFVLIAVSVGLYLLLEYLVARFNIPIQRLGPLAYLAVFGIALAGNAAILIPVYFHVSIMITVASMMTQVSPWGFVIVALVASIGGALGELSGYYAGYLGKRLVNAENAPGYRRFVDWMQRYGPWGILIISLQPILPFDVAGLLAGISKIPLWKFLLPCWGGKFPKYLLGCYLGGTFLEWLWRFLPALPL